MQLTFLKSDLKTPYHIPFNMILVKAGFPSPTEDYIEENLDLNYI
jgi:hypothetical protein